VERVRDLLKKGIDNFPDEARIASIKTEIEREYLSLAVH
jgi:hypothetical protein